MSDDVEMLGVADVDLHGAVQATVDASGLVIDCVGADEFVNEPPTTLVNNRIEWRGRWGTIVRHSVEADCLYVRWDVPEERG